jgi:hypothetical protein
MENLGLPNPSMNWESPALTETWDKFKQHCNLMFDGPLSEKNQRQRVSYLLLWVGERGRDIYSTFKFAPARDAVAATDTQPSILAVPAEDPYHLETVYGKFKDYVTPKSNVIFAHYKFYNKVQGPNESVDNFVTDVKMLIRDCGFLPVIVDEMIRDRLVYGTNSNKVRGRYIDRSADLTAQLAIDIARAYESSQSQLKKMSGENANVDAVRTKKYHASGGTRRPSHSATPSVDSKSTSRDSKSTSRDSKNPQ